MSMHSFYFYLPPEDFPEEIPENANFYWPGFRKGIYCWTLQTYLNLRSQDFPCILTDEFPDTGIVLAHWDSLPIDLEPSPQQLIVCFQADRARHPYAQVHIVQNRDSARRDLMTWGDRYLLPGQDYYMPHWPQPGLLARSPERGDRFENLGYFGLEANLLPKFKTKKWQEQLNDLGLSWLIVQEFDRWNDYSHVDAVVAIRSFKQTGFTWKPATKLFNAWHAGVPAILGCESAYQAERKSDLDYLEVSTLEETLQAIRRLKDNVHLRQSMVKQGRIRAQETTQSFLTNRWTYLLQKDLSENYEQWIQSKLYRETFWRRRKLAINSRSRRKNLQGFRNRFSFRAPLRKLLR
jgi:hypothetical protein